MLKKIVCSCFDAVFPQYFSYIMGNLNTTNQYYASQFRWSLTLSSKYIKVGVKNAPAGLIIRIESLHSKQKTQHHVTCHRLKRIVQLINIVFCLSKTTWASFLRGFCWRLRDIWEIVLGYLRDKQLFLCQGYLGVISGIFEGYLRNIWGIFNGYLRNIWGIFKGHTRDIWGIFVHFKTPSRIYSNGTRTTIRVHSIVSYSVVIMWTLLGRFVTQTNWVLLNCYMSDIWYKYSVATLDIDFVHMVVLTTHLLFQIDRDCYYVLSERFAVYALLYHETPLYCGHCETFSNSITFSFVFCLCINE